MAHMLRTFNSGMGEVGGRERVVRRKAGGRDRKGRGGAGRERSHICSQGFFVVSRTIITKYEVLLYFVKIS